MPPLSLKLTARNCIVGSQLGRHITAISQLISDARVLPGLLHWCPNLHALSLAVDPVKADGPLQWPPRLRSLVFHAPRAVSVDRINELLLSFSSLPCLESLSLLLSDADCRIRFACFAAHPTLTSLTLEYDRDLSYGCMSPEQIVDVRSLSITQFKLDSISTLVLAELLAPPHSLQWTELYLPATCVLDLPTASLLRSLPSLTEMQVQRIPRGRFVDFLQFTPLLRSIEWSHLSEMDSQAGKLMRALSQCPALTKLFLRGSSVINSHMLAALFVTLPKLRALRLSGLHTLSSLDWIAAAPSLSRSLEELDLLACPLIPASNLPLLLSLQSLRCLCIEDCDGIDLSDEERASWTLPVRAMPRLREFSFWPHPWQ